MKKSIIVIIVCLNLTSEFSYNMNIPEENGFIISTCASNQQTYFIESSDTILYLKKLSQKLYDEKKYQEVYNVFSYLAEYYKRCNNAPKFFDYRNKALNCLSIYGDPGNALDSLFLLINNYDNSKINDQYLTEALIDNFITNFRHVQIYPRKLSYLDYLTDSLNCDISLNNSILLLKHRLTITKNLGITDELINSYYKLLRKKLIPKDEILYELELGDFYNEIIEYQLSNVTLLNLLCKKELNSTDKSRIFNIIGNNYLHLNKLSLCSHFYNLSLKLRQEVANNSEYLRVIYNNLANYYTYVGRIDSARFLYYEALRLSIQEYGNISPESAFQNNNLGNHYFNLEKYDSAFIIYQKSYDIKQRLENYKDIDIIHSLYNLGLTFSKLGESQKAIPFLKKSIYKNFELAKKYSLKNGLSSPDDYIISCDILGNTYYNLHKAKNNNNFLDSAKFFYEEAIKTNDSIIFSTPIESSKILINHSNKKIIEDYLLCLLPDQPTGNYIITDTIKTISLFDKVHNYVLFNKLSEITQFHENSLIASVTRTNFPLDCDYNAIEILEDNRSSDINEICRLSNILFTKIKNSKWAPHNIDRLNNCNLLWKKRDYPYSRIPLLKNQQTIILEYTTVKDFLFCLAISSNSIKVVRIGKVNYLEKLVNDCNDNLRKFSLDFKQLYKLSNILLSPLSNINNTIKKIIVIKDENILSIPFDVLLLTTPKNDYQSNKYLINSYDISYSYSIYLSLMDTFKIKEQKQFDFVGFAPTRIFVDKQNTFDDLTHSMDEVNYVSSLFVNFNLKPLVMTGTDANSENFFNYACKTSVLHIAAHSPTWGNSLQGGFLLNSSINQQPYTLISYYDILNLDNSPDMVVIATCSSNSGKIIEGEGIQNLGRAFALKGASYVVSSHFRLEDKFSYKFMSSFYSKFLLTNNVSHSICETKREFMKNNIYSYPTFWSNFNVIEK